MLRYELHPIFKRYWVCNDHFDGELHGLGDELGRDCMVASFLPENVDFMRMYIGDGSKNEDWFGWNADVMAPISGTVKAVYINPVVNKPGIMNPSRASSIVIEADDGVTVILAHVQDIQVAVGDSVAEGQVIAKVGNNGYARSPHIHIGAWKDNKPIAIDFDPKKVAEIYNRVGEIFWIFGISEKEFLARRSKS